MFYTARQALKTMNLDEMNLDELGLLAANLASVDLGYQEVGIDKPEWFDELRGEVKVTLELRIRADKQRQLKNLKARVEALKSTKDKRLEVEKQIAVLEKELA